MTTQTRMALQRAVMGQQGWPQSLPELFERDPVPFSSIRHMAIDLQRKFLNNSELAQIARYIDQNVAPEFNRMGVPTYWVYWPRYACTMPKNLRELQQRGRERVLAEVDYDIHPAPGDHILPKNNDSALSHIFKGESKDLTLTHQRLRRDRARLLLLSGVYFNSCVAATAVDACNRGYHVAVMTDASDAPENRAYYARDMDEAGVIFTTSEEAFAVLRQQAQRVVNGNHLK